MTTGGGAEDAPRRFGSTSTTPRVVANQRRPSADFHPAGCEAPLHWADSMPSDRPNDLERIAGILPASYWPKSRSHVRAMPRFEDVQRLSPSSRISKATSSKSPSRVVYVLA